MRPGDLVFFHGSGFVDGAIRVCERIRRDWPSGNEAAGAHWNHVAILAAPVGKDWTLIQAQGHGVEEGQLLSEATAGTYEVVPLPPQLTGNHAVGFARAQVGRKYGFVTIGSIVVTLFTPTFFNVMWPGTWICSALGAESWRAAGWIHNWGDIYQVSPAQLFLAARNNG